MVTKGMILTWKKEKIFFRKGDKDVYLKVMSVNESTQTFNLKECTKNGRVYLTGNSRKDVEFDEFYRKVKSGVWEIKE